MNLLIEKGADVNAHGGSDGRTPLHLAVDACCVSAVTLLLDHGALTNKQDFSDATPLQVAAQKGDYRIARLLVSRSPDSLIFVEASTWRALLPGSQCHLEIVIGKSTTIVKRMDKDVRDRAYPLFHDGMELPPNAVDFMGANIGSRRILYVYLSFCWLIIQRSHSIETAYLVTGRCFYLHRLVSVVVGGEKWELILPLANIRRKETQHGDYSLAYYPVERL
ncbi:ankyrin-2 [Penicillium lividum]|nr:ankyrin-2 [Penicillium lividum]